MVVAVVGGKVFGKLSRLSGYLGPASWEGDAGVLCIRV